MKSRASRLAFAIGLTLAQGARGEDTFDALLLGSNEVPGPSLADGSILAVVSVDGTNVSLSLTLKGLQGWMAAHIHKGAAGRTGKLVVDFSWSSWPENPSSTLFASASAKVAADLVANPQSYYVHVHTPGFPSGAARGQLTARLKADPAPTAQVSRLPLGGQLLPGRNGPPLPGPGVGPASSPPAPAVVPALIQVPGLAEQRRVRRLGRLQPARPTRRSASGRCRSRSTAIRTSGWKPPRPRDSASTSPRPAIAR